MFFLSSLLVAAAMCYFTVKAAHGFGGNRAMIESAFVEFNKVRGGCDCGK